MAGRQTAPNRGRLFSASTAMFLAAAWHAGPTFASASSPEMCDSAEKPSLEISRNDLEVLKMGRDTAAVTANVKEPESDSDAYLPTNYLTPRAGAALRQAREKPSAPASDIPLPEIPRTADDQQPAIKARVPGVSDGDLVRFKRHMYRRDI